MMKKFAFLLAIVAVFAMSACAFAAEPYVAGSVKSLEADTDPGNMGKMTEETKPDEPDSGDLVDGKYSAKVYYYGAISATQKATAGVKLTQGAASPQQFYAMPGSAAFENDQNKFGGDADVATRTGVLELTAADPVTYTFGIGNHDASGLNENYTKAALALTPTKVELVMPGTISIDEGTEETEVKITLKDKTLVPHFSGDGFKADPPPGRSPSIRHKDGEPDTLVIHSGSADPGTYIYEIKTEPGTSLTVDETGGATGITVANFPNNETKVGEMTVIIVGYEVTPTSADWNSASPDVVGFTVNMKNDDFKGIGLKKPNDTDGTDISDIDSEFYTVTPTADGIEIEIALEYLVKHLTVSGDYVINVADEDNRQAYFTLRVTIDPENDVPAKGVQPLAEDAQKGPPGIEYEIIQIRLSAGSVKALLPEEMRDVVSDDGRIKQDEAAKLTGADPDTLTVLHSVAATFDLPDSTIAPFTFDVKGAELVSEEVDGIRWYDAIIHKMFVRDDAPASVRLAPARTFDAIKDGTYMIMSEDMEEDEHGVRPIARLLSDDYVIERDEEKYKLVVFVEDDGDYDLDKKAGRVVDPIAIQESTGASGSSSSSGGCDAGAGLVALTGLAVLAMGARKRK